MLEKKASVLVIDDSEPTLFLLENILSPHFKVKCIKDAQSAFNIFSLKDFDIIILDLMMPGMNGIDFIKYFRGRKEYNHVPIIVLTAMHNTEEDIAHLFELGINDYITKPFFAVELIARIKAHSKIKILTEELIEANKKLQFSATHDDLTGVYNRNSIFEFIENEISRLKRKNCDLSIIMFDIDNFKIINDTYGHIAGDKVLQKIVKIIRKIIRESDLIGRYGGDEFIIVLPETELSRAKEIGERILKRISDEKFKHKNSTFKVNISIGITRYIKGESLIKLNERVDTALYEAKEKGKNCIIVK